MSLAAVLSCLRGRRLQLAWRQGRLSAPAHGIAFANLTWAAGQAVAATSDVVP